MSFESKKSASKESEEANIKEREIALFGVAISKGGLLENIYSHFTLEDLEFLEREFSVKGIYVIHFKGLDSAEKWSALSSELDTLKHVLEEYRLEKAGVAHSLDERMALRNTYVPRIKEIFKKFN